MSQPPQSPPHAQQGLMAQKPAVDVQLLGGVLSNTLNQDGNIRKQAETKLAEIERMVGYPGTLLQLVAMKQAPQPIRHSAILRLKNIVNDNWTIREGKEQRISDVDRKVIKDNLLDSIIFQAEPKIRVQLLEVMYKIGYCDFPERWPELLPAVMNNFKSNDQQRIYGALCVLHKLFKKYQFKKQELRKPMMDFVRAVFPVLLPLFNHVINLDNPQGHEFCRQLVKIFFLACHLEIPPFLQDPNIFSAWMVNCMKLFERPYPAKEHKQGQALRELPLWKCKKWVSRIFTRLFTRFGRPAYVTDEDKKPFARFYFAKWSGPILMTYFKYLKEYAQTGLTTAPILQSIYVYLTAAMTHKELYAGIKPNLEFLLFQNILPVLSLQKEDLVMFRTNPHEFVRRSLDVMEEFLDPRTSASNLLIDLVRDRTRDTLQPIITNIGKIVTAYAQTPNEKKNFVQKEGAMRMFGSIRKLLLTKKDLQDPIEQLIGAHILPEFGNPLGFMRARACWVIGQFSRLQYKNKQIHERAVLSVCNSLKDKELPVKLEAAIAVARIVDSTEGVAELLRPHIGTIFEQYFSLFDELGNEEVVHTLSGLIESFQAEVVPYAVKLYQKLAGMCQQFIHADVGDDEAAVTAIQCIRCMNAILSAIHNVPALYPQLEKIAQPLIKELMTPDGIEFLDETLEMITSFTYLSSEISPFMWTLLPEICKIYHNNGADYIGSMLAPIDNFISRGNDRFVGSKDPNYLKMVFDICAALYKDPEREVECQYACKMIETTLAHSRGKVDFLIAPILQISVEKLKTAKDDALKLLVIDVIAGAAYYNPLLFSQVCDQGGPDFTEQLFNRWLSHIELMDESEKHLKMTVLGLSALMHIPTSKLPKRAQANFHEVLLQNMGCLSNLYALEYDEKGEDVKESTNAVEAGDSDKDENEFEDIVDKPEYEDVDDSEQEVKIQHALGAAALGLSDSVDEDNYESPLDDVDPYIFFAQSLEALQKVDGGYYNKWMQALTKEHRERLQTLMNEATKQQLEKQKEAKEKAANDHKSPSK